MTGGAPTDSAKGSPIHPSSGQARRAGSCVEALGHPSSRFGQRSDLSSLFIALGSSRLDSLC